MRFRTLALALALACGITGLAEAKTKKAVIHSQYKPGKAKKFKPAKKVKAGKYKSPYKVQKRTVKKRTVTR